MTIRFVRKQIGNTLIFAENENKVPIITIGPHWPGLIFTIVIEFCGTYLNLNMLSDRKKRYYIHKNAHNYEIVLFLLHVFTYIMLILSLLFLLLTGCSNPGIVTKDTVTADIKILNSDDDMESLLPLGRRDPRKDKYCSICNVDQPRGAEHCYDCGVCIEKLDHHCPWMGKCVGKRNMYVFIIFNICWIAHLTEFALCAIFLP